MREQTIIFFLVVIILVLCLIIIYQRFAFHRGIQAKIRQISEKLAEISETGSDEKIMVFTDNPVLMALDGQINRLLTDRQKMRADFKRTENAAKTMLSNISHDIKTPLTVILGYLEIMRLKNAEDEMLKKVEAKAEQVLNLIHQFFTLAKLESGDLDLRLCKINLNEVCRENVLAFYDLLTQKEFQVDLRIPEKPVFVQGDPEALQRILYNLLSNVIRYGIDGKYLGIFLRQDKGSVYIDVVDKGKGIEQKDAANVFDRLYTTADSRNRDWQGNGLGLTIAKNLAVRLGGDLFLNSTPNVQTTFTVKLKKTGDAIACERNS